MRRALNAGLWGLLGLVGGAGHLALKHCDSLSPQNLFRLEFVNFHGGQPIHF